MGCISRIAGSWQLKTMSTLRKRDKSPTGLPERLINWDRMVILLGGGTKARQARDIDAAQVRWQAYKQERRHARQSPSGE